MDILISKEVSFDLLKKLDIINTLSSFLNNHFSIKHWGNGVENIQILIHCLDPEIGMFRDFETGLVIHKKYIKSKKCLEFAFKLNYQEVKNANTKSELLGIIATGFQIGLVQIKDMLIKDFDIEKFGKELEKAIHHLSNIIITLQ